MRLVQLLGLPHFDDREMVGPRDIAQSFEANKSGVLTVIRRELLEQLGRVGRKIRVNIDIGDHVDLRFGLLLRENHAQGGES